MIRKEHTYNVKSFAVDKKQRVFFVNVSNNLCLENKVILDGEYSIRGVQNESLILFDEKFSTSSILNLGNFELSQRPYSMLLIGTSKEKFFGVIRENNVFKFAFFNFSDLSLDKVYPIDFEIGKWKLFDNQLIIVKGQKEIKSIDLETKDTSWKKSASDIARSNVGKIESPIIRMDDKLFYYYVDIEDPTKNETYVISREKAEIIKTLPNFTGSIKESNGLLYTSHEKLLQTLDPETFEVREIDLVPELTKHGFKRIDYEKWFVEDNKLYFAQNIGENYAKIGVFDLESETIIDKVDLAKENGTVGTLKKNGDRLYVHTQDRTLHIFELEENLA